MRILFVGDTHMNHHGSIHAANRWADLAKVDVILQVGDFGYTFSDDLLEAVAAAPCPWWFIRGNHDDTDWLRAAIESHGRRRWPDTPPSVNKVAENLYWIEDGAILNLGGTRIACIGGAASIDKEYRIEGESWWPDEGVNEHSLERLGLEVGFTGPVDLLVTHDIPNSLVDLGLVDYMLLEQNIYFKRDHAMSQVSRGRLQLAYENCQPLVVIHGHYHVGYDTNVEPDLYDHDGTVSLIHGLAANGDPGAHLIYDTETARTTRDMSTPKP